MWKENRYRAISKMYTSREISHIGKIPSEYDPVDI